MNQQNALLNLTTFRIYSRRIDQVVKGNEKSDWLKRERNIRMFLSLSYWAMWLRSRFWLTLKNASLNVWRKYQEWRKSKLCLMVQIQRNSRARPMFDWFYFLETLRHIYIENEELIQTIFFFIIKNQHWRLKLLRYFLILSHIFYDSLPRLVYIPFERKNLATNKVMYLIINVWNSI